MTTPNRPEPATPARGFSARLLKSVNTIVFMPIPLAHSNRNQGKRRTFGEDVSRVARISPNVTGRGDAPKARYTPSFLNAERHIAKFLQRPVAGGFRIRSPRDAFPGSHRQMAANFLVHTASNSHCLPSPSRRVSERELVLKPVRRAGEDRGLARGLQLATATLGARVLNARRVRAESRFAFFNY
jgi:hypothetical protein